ncbi:MAG: glycerol-3-phosphate dehydrogenase C-terminal domain-containing protein, partial [Bacillota bacterium]
SLPVARGAWTEQACLPGGDLFGAHPSNRSVLEFDSYVQQLQQKYRWLPGALTARYARAYGTRTDTLLAGRRTLAEMGEEVLPGVYAAEVDYLMQLEWALTARDILWRRSKLGLHLPTDAEAKLDRWMKANRNTRDKHASTERRASHAF